MVNKKRLTRLGEPFEFVPFDPCLCCGRWNQENPGDIVKRRPLLVVIAMQVHLRGDPRTSVAQQLLNRLQVFALVVQNRAHGMAEGMPADVLRDPRCECGGADVIH